jgi:hypothetical protein
MAKKCCPACGQTLPPKLKLAIKLRASQMLIVERVHRAGKEGILSTDLTDYVYADDPDGGPEAARKVLASRIWIINNRLKHIGLHINAPVGTRAPTAYVLEKL